jgi:hypothetical protein
VKFSKSRKRASDAEGITLDMPVLDSHPNRHPFEGCLTLIDQASDKAPSGARKHRVILTRAAAASALPSLLGMAVDFSANWEGHDSRQKCGIITAASIQGKRVVVSGFIYGKDYPEIAKASVDALLGMSYELSDAHVADMRAEVWTLTRAVFTGAAILLRDKAAYRDTSFRMLSASGKPAQELTIRGEQP